MQSLQWTCLLHTAWETFSLRQMSVTQWAGPAHMLFSVHAHKTNYMERQMTNKLAKWQVFDFIEIGMHGMCSQPAHIFAYIWYKKKIINYVHTLDNNWMSGVSNRHCLSSSLIAFAFCEHAFMYVRLFACMKSVSSSHMSNRLTIQRPNAKHTFQYIYTKNVCP